ncbi:exopolysaccharide biosynthesis polyprenyl glycosylphosphotransferase [Ligilactobacillus sp. WILCCON 0076]|uniref:Exopolysaccharide biosynthesis polyprenyl glycosylphosphotransferase n=1 Tax=Ligilactobacillus ubinensis TaxID=2876789 RepID=A0A9X2FLH0_9LACO|nr:sugar transferase [Ligilactobacillus ubinensis]MCP0887839.1 exopolysaccharide biosynthesis polyprenyl glycosylphosphotransferase [Ligilactobacillus ubinensis]
MAEHKRGSYLDKSRLEHRYIYRGIKRLSDFILSLLGLVVLSPIFLLIALLIKTEDRGPVFFKQKRVGKNGKTFQMYKFRSMRVDAEFLLANLLKYNEVEGPMFKMKYDPRVTRIGCFIRKTSIDELPQLLNVLMGNMSLVGPRPPLPREVKEYDDYAKQRLYIVPGCTGMWQVTARNDAGFSEMLELDLQYIRESSFWLDVKIIFMTIKIIFWPNNAY